MGRTGMAGQARDNVTVYHVPVLRDQAVAFLVADRGGVYVDGTLGGGGHSEAILKRLNKKGHVIGIDRDEEALNFSRQRLSVYKERMSLVHGEFAHVNDILADLSVGRIDGFLLDLGVSSHQIMTAGRGFSYRQSGPLDMRMDRRQSETAMDLIHRHSEKNLADLLYIYGEEHLSRKIARRIVHERERGTLGDTGDLARVVCSVVRGRYQVKSLARVFQALRIAVNDEMQQLKSALENIYPLLGNGARVVVISYHSLEDRMVKRYFQGRSVSYLRSDDFPERTGYRFRLLTRKPVLPTEEEMTSVPASRSARLRAAQKEEE